MDVSTTLKKQYKISFKIQRYILSRIFFPFSYWNDNFQRKSSQKIVIHIYSRSGLFDFGSNRRVKINQPNFTLLHRNFQNQDL